MRRNDKGGGMGFIYVLHNPNRNAVKIGFSGNPMSRIAQLRTASPDPLVLKMVFEGPQSAERRLHAIFADHRLSGEWFDARMVTPRRIMSEVREFYPAPEDGERDFRPIEVDSEFHVNLDTGEEIEVFDLRSTEWINSKPHLYCVWEVEGEESGEGESGGIATYYGKTENDMTPPDPTALIVMATDNRYRFWAINSIRPVHTSYGP